MRVQLDNSSTYSQEGDFASELLSKSGSFGRPVHCNMGRWCPHGGQVGGQSMRGDMSPNCSKCSPGQVVLVGQQSPNGGAGHRVNR